MTSCATCLAFEPAETGDAGGCRRYAPMTDFSASGAAPVWPAVSRDDWCLQHRQSDAPFGLTFIPPGTLDDYGSGDA